MNEHERVDLVVMDDVPHNYEDEKRKFLTKRTFVVLPSGGRLAAIEIAIDDERRENVGGRMMSMLMLLNIESGSNFTFKESR